MKTTSEAIPNILLRQAREKHDWTQEEVAEKIDTTARNVSRWECGITSPTSYFRQKLCELFGKNTEELGLFRQLLNTQQAQANCQKALERPRYKTKQGTEFIGREEDIQALWNMLVKEKELFVTIIGIPGVGKTELARQIKEFAAEREYFSNVAFLTLAHEREIDTDTVLRLITEKLQKYDLQKKTLLIIDDCERIADIAKARDELYNLVNNKKQLTILATSRVHLSEKEHQLKPFDVERLKYDEKVETLQTNDAVRLFLGIANRNGKVLTLGNDNAWEIAAICCQGLNGLPLALEIVASRMEELGIEDIVHERLLKGTIQDVPNKIPADERHRSLAIAIAWSYDRLPPQQQKLFRRLAVFSAKCSIKSAAEVCNLGDLPTKEEFEKIIYPLSDSSLITLTNGWIDIPHNTLRDFALRKLQEEQEFEQVDQRFFAYYKRLVTDYISAKYFDQKSMRELAADTKILRGESGNLYWINKDLYPYSGAELSFMNIYSSDDRYNSGSTTGFWIIYRLETAGYLLNQICRKALRLTKEIEAKNHTQMDYSRRMINFVEEILKEFQQSAENLWRKIIVHRRGKEWGSRIITIHENVDEGKGYFLATLHQALISIEGKIKEKDHVEIELSQILHYLEYIIIIAEKEFMNIPKHLNIPSTFRSNAELAMEIYNHAAEPVTLEGLPKYLSYA